MRMSASVNLGVCSNMRLEFVECHMREADNGRDHRAGTIIMQAENNTRKSGFACITLLSGVYESVSSLGILISVGWTDEISL